MSDEGAATNEAEPIAALLADLQAQSAAVWPTVTVDRAGFAEHLRACAGALGGSLEQGLGTLRTADLYLAYGAGHDAPHAVELFIDKFLAPIGAAVDAIDTAPAFVDEVRQALHEHLLVGPPGQRRILQYQGRAALSTWVGVAAQRLALGMLRKDGARQRAAARAGEEPAPLQLDPELEYLKTHYRGSFEEALAAAIAKLPQRHRTVLRLYSISGLTLARIGIMFQVDESTVSRWVQRAREAIFEEAQKELGRRLGIRVDEVPSLVRMVTSQLDISVARLLRNDGNTEDDATRSR